MSAKKLGSAGRARGPERPGKEANPKTNFTLCTAGHRNVLGKDSKKLNIGMETGPVSCMALPSSVLPRWVFVCQTSIEKAPKEAGFVQCHWSLVKYQEAYWGTESI